MGKLKAWLKGLGIFQYILLVIFGFAAVSAAADALPHASYISVTFKQHKDTAAVRTETETEAVPVPYGQTTVDDPSYQPGYSEVTTPGQDGIKAVTYQLTYIDGVMAQKKAIKEVLTDAPIDEVTTTGPYTTDMADPLAGNPDSCVPSDDGNCQ